MRLPTPDPLASATLVAFCLLASAYSLWGVLQTACGFGWMVIATGFFFALIGGVLLLVWVVQQLTEDWF